MNKPQKLQDLLGSEDTEKLAGLLRGLYDIHSKTGNEDIITGSEEVIVAILELFWSLDHKITGQIHELRIEMHSELGRLQIKYDAQLKEMEKRINKLRKRKFW